MVKDQAKESTEDLKDCPVAAALEIIGERWTLLIIRDLLRRQARRFQDLELSLEGISPNTLSARLKRLEEAGIVERRFYEEHPPRAEYVLTDRGRALGPIVLALKRWGETYALGDGEGR
ncbi:MAG: winged helix-turn-helix transcriptional regulator [Hyphomicrobium sp.]